MNLLFLEDGGLPLVNTVVYIVFWKMDDCHWLLLLFILSIFHVEGFFVLLL